MGIGKIIGLVTAAMMLGSKLIDWYRTKPTKPVGENNEEPDFVPVADGGLPDRQPD
jgi:hypothetical protein